MVEIIIPHHRVVQKLYDKYQQALIKSTVYESAKSAGFDFARPLSKVSFALVVILTLSLTIGQLEIETRLLDAIIIIVLAALGVGAAISLGLGSRSASENIVYL